MQLYHDLPGCQAGSSATIRLMPYKDPQKQKQAQARYFKENQARLRGSQNVKRNLMRRLTQDIKGSTPCRDCGESFPHYIMEFDHLPQFKKSFNVSNISGCSSMEALKAEISKCDVVCSNCHAHRTFMRQTKEPEGVEPSHPVRGALG